MPYPYTVTVTVGDHVITHTRGTPGTPYTGPLPAVLDGLTFGWQFPDSDVFPVQPDPATATLSLIGETSAELGDIDVGTRVKVIVDVGLTGGSWPIGFSGRVAQCDGHPVKFTHPTTGERVLGWQLDLIARDPNADLGELTYSEKYSPAATGGLLDWLNTIYLDSGLPGPHWDTSGNDIIIGVPSDGRMKGNLLELGEDLLRQVANDDLSSLGVGFTRGVILPNYAADGYPDPAKPYSLEWLISRSFTPSVLPYRVTRDPAADVYYLEAVSQGPEGDASLVLDAGYLGFDAKWARTKRDAINRCYVTSEIGSWSTVRRGSLRPPGFPVIAATIDTRLVNRSDAQNLGDMYTKELFAGPGTIWELETVTWYASRQDTLPWVISALCLPPDESSGGFWASLVTSIPVILTNIPTSQQPNSGRDYAGTLRAVQWEFDTGEFNIDLTLSSRVPRVTNGVTVSAFTWSDYTVVQTATSDPDAPVWTDLDRTDTWIDYRLARAASIDY